MSVPPLRIVLDVRQPLAYLALRPALELAGEFDAMSQVLPFEGKVLRAPSTPQPDDDRSVRHRRNRAEMIAREIDVYADALGLDLREPYREGSSRALYLAWLWVRERCPERLADFLEEAFARYWRVALDADDARGVRQLLDDLGIAAEGLDAWAASTGEKALDSLSNELREAGIFQAPTYLLGEEPFVGRQHLPMVRWILGGRRGPGPI